MLRSIEMTPLRRASFGKCIFCGNTENLTDEHIVPETLTGIGEMLIVHGSCRDCNNYANETYEQPAFKADFLPVRHMLELKRKRRGKKTKPRRMPLVSYTATHMTGRPEDFNEELPPKNYPQEFEFIVHEPAGRLVGIDRSGGSDQIRVGILRLGLPGRTTPASVTTNHAHIMGGPEMVVAKMAYCWAVAEKGLDAFDAADLLDLLCGRRSDVFNFVGGALVAEQLPMLRLHKFYFRKRGELTTVLVHLFASFGGPVHEVVIGKDK
jgi:hypothetical protein